MSALDLFALPLNQRVLVEASAGTGKTWTITGLYVRLLLEAGFGVDEILVVTYTKAATAELKERIRSRLVEALAALQSEQPSADPFCARLQVQHAGALETVRRTLRLAVQRFDEAAIYTIHGFCQRVLQEAAFAAGADFEQDLIADETELLRAIVADVWRCEVARSTGFWAEFLVEGQQTPAAWLKRIQSHTGKPFLRSVPITALPTDQQEAALRQQYGEARQRWLNEREAIIAALQAAISAKCLNGQSYKADKLLVQAQALDEALFEDSPSWRPAVWLEALKPFSAAQLADKTNKGKATPEHGFFSVVQRLMETIEALVQGFEARRDGLACELLRRCALLLPLRKAELGVLSFNDLLNTLAQALDGERGALLARAIQTRFPAALVDEFQDTDPVQYRIVERIYRDVASPLFLVGDPKQAIYSFRGADLATYLAARRATPLRESLDTNRRSVPALVNSVNTLFDSARCAAPFVDAEIPYRPVMSLDKAERLVGCQDEGAALRFLMLDSEDGKPLGRELAKQWAAEVTAAEIARLLSGSAGFEREGSFCALSGGDIAVLVANSHQAREVAAALGRRGIVSVRRSQDSVFQSAEALELLRILLAVAEPSRGPRLAAALATEALGFDAPALAAQQSDDSANEQVLEQFLRWRALWQKDGVMRLMRTLLAEPGRDGLSLAERLLRFSDGERRLTNWLHLAELLQVQSRKRPELASVLDWFAEQLQSPERGQSEERDDLLRLESDAKRVQLVTIHSSKGLEYPIVFCPYLWEEGLRHSSEQGMALFHDADGGAWLDLGSTALASNQERMALERFAERLRLLYVALTRPVHRAYIVWGAIAAHPASGKGLQACALSWLLHGPRAIAQAPLAALEPLKKPESAQIHAQVLSFAQDAKAQGGTVAVLPSATLAQLLATHYPRPAERLEPAAPVLRVLPRSLKVHWRVTSFSGLSAGHGQETPDRDKPIAAAQPEPETAQTAAQTVATPETDAPAETFTIHGFARGANAGTCLHTIYERWEFTSTDEAALAALVGRTLDAYALMPGKHRERWVAAVADNVRQVLNADLGGYALQQIGPEARLVELEFTLPATALKLAELKRLLAEPRFGLPVEFAQAATELRDDELRGFLKGFIDLVYRAPDGRFYVLDWKSNYLGANAAAYTQAAMTSAMAHAHYYLQALLYLLALHRYLRRRLPDYRMSRDLGGAWYVFLRGVTPGANSGLYCLQPSEALIDALDGLFSGVLP